MKNDGAAKTAVKRKKEMMHPGNISSLSLLRLTFSSVVLK